MTHPVIGKALSEGVTIALNGVGGIRLGGEPESIEKSAPVVSKFKAELLAHLKG